MTALLDGGVLAALTIAEHEHHHRAGRWLAAEPAFALCPLTEAALLRFLLRLGESPQTAWAVLAGLQEHPKSEFWPADLSPAKIPTASITTAANLEADYLIALARAKGGTVATFDERLVADQPDATLLVPA